MLELSLREALALADNVVRVGHLFLAASRMDPLASPGMSELPIEWGSFAQAIRNDMLDVAERARMWREHQRAAKHVAESRVEVRQVDERAGLERVLIDGEPVWTGFAARVLLELVDVVHRHDRQ